VFISLSAITFSTQNAQAATTPLCGPNIVTGSEVYTASSVNYGGKQFDIIGFNNNGNKVGSAGPNNSVTLLLNNSEPNNNVGNGNPNYSLSALLTNTTAFVATLSDTSDIIERTLSGGSGYEDDGDYMDDNVTGPDVPNQKAWVLSVDEASHLIVSEREFKGQYWLRTPGMFGYSRALVMPNASIEIVGSVDSAAELRPALYLDINSLAFAGLTFDSALPIGACIAEPHNPIGINFVAETVTGFDTDTQGWSLADSFAGLSTPVQLTSTSLDVSTNISATSSALFYNKATTSTDHFDSYYNNDKQPTESLAKLVIPARPSAPSGLSGVAPSDVGASDGKITGVSNKMEYSTDEATWTSVTGAAITGLTSGTYFVRTIADQSASKFKSFATEVIVKEGSSPSSGPGSGPSSGQPGSGTGPSAGDGEFSSEGTAQTGVDFTGLELLIAMMLLGAVVLRRPAIGTTQLDFVNANQTDLSSRNDNFNKTALQTRSRLPRSARNDG
jgi:hypothetical protein